MKYQPTLEGIEPPGRPAVTPEMIAEAAAKLCSENRWDDGADDLVKCFRRGMDGYELARDLEDRCGWSITVQDVDALDCMAGKVEGLHQAACWEWARENNIQPPLPVGTMTTRGEITGISEYSPATYEVRANGETNESRRYLIRFEDARALAAISAEKAGEV